MTLHVAIYEWPMNLSYAFLTRHQVTFHDNMDVDFVLVIGKPSQWSIFTTLNKLFGGLCTFSCLL